MKKIDRIMIPIYCGDVLVHFKWNIIVDEIPSEDEYFEIEDKKGYVVQVVEDEETEQDSDYILYNVYYDVNKGDWYDKMIDCSILNIAVHK